MVNFLPPILFALSSVVLLNAADISEPMLFISATVFLIAGLHLSLSLIINKYIYTGVLHGFHVAMAFFTAYIFVNRDHVVRETAFDFSVFNSANIQIVLINLVFASLVIYLTWFVLKRRNSSLLTATPQRIVFELIGSLERFPAALIPISLILSFCIALFFFITNASILEIQYPLQKRTHWIPGELIKLPVFIAVFGVGLAYAKRLQRGGTFRTWLRLAQVNFLWVSAIMLLLIGSRGFFTFLLLIIGSFEIFVWRKRRGSLAWGTLFVGFSWLTYISWPYMRSTLSWLPATQVLENALLIGFGFGSGADWASAATSEIRLTDYTMIGQSLFHFLYVVELIKNGVSLGGTTFLNLIPQSLPDVLDGVLWTRPINDNWRLGDHFSHGGGFLVIANAYWNGGALVALAFTSLLAGIFAWFDRQLSRPSTSLIYRAVYWLWLPIMLIQLGYGIQGLARVIQLLAFIIIIQRFFRKQPMQIKPTNRLPTSDKA